MIIEEVQNKHYPALKELFLNERKKTFSWLDTSKFHLDDFEKYTQGEYILTALVNDIPVGFISIWMPTNFIHHLYVDEKYQNKKIGTELLKAAIAVTKSAVTLKCLENNTKAIEFYKKRGFTEKEKAYSQHGGCIFLKSSEEIV
ncbi:GNAT family N-acetyltransferase [Flavobacterium sp. SORGH_AS_0622]|uniref:GNAT family N-acetyltransferase n=1 Tax=Flavobacterium sp. SORGH_AS_0622 TaxID=3041772 RepID=UPI002784032D|nr:GNAT family N-acetyltransferase [Flavobacterium sp. SORGH_AS_0622]MDQ1166833.1 ribosomal protein S18 acetylase RimI-like enzyme [Flavobacterium sp. SORGH_AS_0622]